MDNFTAMSTILARTNTMAIHYEEPVNVVLTGEQVRKIKIQCSAKFRKYTSELLPQLDANPPQRVEVGATTMETSEEIMAKLAGALDDYMQYRLQSRNGPRAPLSNDAKYIFQNTANLWLKESGTENMPFGELIVVNALRTVDDSIAEILGAAATPHYRA